MIRWRTHRDQARSTPSTSWRRGERPLRTAVSSQTWPSTLQTRSSKGESASFRTRHTDTGSLSFILCVVLL
jgi:hypothetical protein